MIDFNMKVTRRRLLRGGLVMAAGLALPVPAYCRSVEKLSGERAISLTNTHTGESLNRIVYWLDGQYLADSLAQLNWLLRDHRNDSVKKIEPALFDMLRRLSAKLENKEPFNIVSGYRSPETNENLRAQTKGVAKHSLHLEGKALDIRKPGSDLRALRKAAVSLRAGGVGFYPKSDFVHIDSGRIRYW